MSRGNLALVLHAHLPFVRNPKYSRFFEENWFFEAITECYIPLLLLLNRLVEKSVPAKINLSLSPPLMHMLSDDLLLSRYSNHLQEVLKLLEKETKRYSNNSEQAKIADFYKKRFMTIQKTFESRFNRNLLGALADMEKAGVLEIFACIGTHPYLPIYQTIPGVIKGHIKLAKREFKRHFKKDPPGVWLPECGYFSGLDEYLAKENLNYFIMETHGVLTSIPNPPYGVFTGIRTPNNVCAFGRDQASSREVWSRQHGYPGHRNYREYYKDLSNDVSIDYLGKYFDSAGTPINTSLKYYRITGADDKLPYDPYKAVQTARRDAKTFVKNRMDCVNRLHSHMDKPPLIVSPFDAELFGHWWFEGPDFLESICEEIAANDDTLSMIGLSEAVRNNVADGEYEPSMSSWGEGGFAGVWVNPKNDWMLSMAFEAYSRLHSCAIQIKKPTIQQKKVLNQMARELCLLQASDWPFMVHNNSAKDFAEKEFREHYDNLIRLSIMLEKKKYSIKEINKLEEKNNIFLNINYKWFI